MPVLSPHAEQTSGLVLQQGSGSRWWDAIQCELSAGSVSGVHVPLIGESCGF